MNDYQDVYSLYHHKVCINGQASSGNPAIYTAYAVKLGLPIDSAKVAEAFQLIQKEKGGHKYLIRHPHKLESSPFSRDEVLGWAALKLLKSEHLNNWNFSPYPVPKLSVLALIKQLWQLRPEILHNPYAIQLRHRNYFWQNNLDQLYRFAFSVPLQDRHFILKSWGKFQWYNPAHVFYAAVSFIDSKLPKRSGIKWLKYGTNIGQPHGPGDLEHIQEMVKEFPVDHPIRKSCGF